ncbi:hypothetical protein Tco_0384845 [Tanacetum coccineum]
MLCLCYLRPRSPSTQEEDPRKRNSICHECGETGSLERGKLSSLISELTNEEKRTQPLSWLLSSWTTSAKKYALKSCNTDGFSIQLTLGLLKYAFLSTTGHDVPQIVCVYTSTAERTRVRGSRYECGNAYPGIDYEETFSHVADIRAIRISHAIDANYMDYEIWQMDCQKLTFLKWIISMKRFIMSISEELFTMFQVLIYLGKCFAMKDLGEADIFLESRSAEIAHEVELVMSSASSPAELKLLQSVQLGLGCDLHWTTVKNILKYLMNTKDMFLVYGGVGQAKHFFALLHLQKLSILAAFDASKEAVMQYANSLMSLESLKVLDISMPKFSYHSADVIEFGDIKVIVKACKNMLGSVSGSMYLGVKGLKGKDKGLKEV